MQKEEILVDDYRLSFVFTTPDPFVENNLKSSLKKKVLK
jgi:hypothetical protein